MSGPNVKKVTKFSPPFVWLHFYFPGGCFWFLASLFESNPCIYDTLRSMNYSSIYILRFLIFHLKGHALCRQPIQATAVARSCHFGGLIPSFRHPGKPFWCLGGTPGGHGSSRKDAWGPESFFKTIWGLHFETVWAPRVKHFVVRGRFQVTCCTDV